MYTRNLIYFSILLFWVKAVKCDDDCEFNNIDYKALIDGIDGKVESSEPLHFNNLHKEFPDFKYNITNATIYGMKYCKVILVECDKSDSSNLNFNYGLECPYLNFTYVYQADGHLKSLVIDTDIGYGAAENDLIDYVIKLNGTYEVIVGRDKVSRPVIKDYTVFTNPIGMVQVRATNTYHHDKNKDIIANQFFKENWKQMETWFQHPLVEVFMKLFVKNFNDYSKAM